MCGGGCVDGRRGSYNDAGKWDITNMGAMLLAKDIKKFEGLLNKDYGSAFFDSL